MLVQERNGINERQVFFVVAPVPGARRGECQARGIRIQHVHRLQQSLRVPQLFQNVLPHRPRAESGQRAPFPLQLMNAAGLLGTFIHGQRQTAILQFLVQVNGRGGQK